MGSEEESRFWSLYSTARVVAMSTPLAEEKVMLRRFRLAFDKAFGGIQQDADSIADRHALYLREAEMHAVVAFTPKPRLMRGLADNAFVEGVESLSDLRGSIVVSGHFSHCYTLAFLLAHEAHAGRLEKVAVLARSPEEALRFTPAWYTACASQEVLCDRCLVMVDTTAESASAALGLLLKLLREGTTLLIYADGTVLPPGERGVEVMVGDLAVRFPYGAAKLAEVSGRPLVPARVRQKGESIGVEFSEPVLAVTGSAGATFTRLLQRLIDDALAEDVARWQQWSAVGAELESR